MQLAALLRIALNIEVPLESMQECASIAGASKITNLESKIELNLLNPHLDR